MGAEKYLFYEAVPKWFMFHKKNTILEIELSGIQSFIFGSIVASFVNVVIYRLPRGISIIKGRSYCTNCHHVLQIRDLVPVVSYILLRRKCRYCHTKISLVHPLVEMSGGILSIFCFCHYGLSLTCLFVFVLSMAFLAISIIDIETMTINWNTCSSIHVYLA